MLQVRNLVKYYQVGDGEPICAIDDVSLSIDAGKFVVLHGPSGSGKSTLIDLIAGFLSPDSGTVVVDGLDIAEFSEKQHAEYLLKVLGIIGHPSDLLPGALACENAALKLLRTDPRNATRLIEPLMQELGLGKRMRHPTRKLSMGERQRVSIAQALSLNPKLVLADEPTSNLDTLRSREILKRLQDLCHDRDVALLLVSHDPLAVDYADRVYELRDGHLQARDQDATDLGVSNAPAGR
jgi:ABC-type lipoprotein export system ATPase subunit